MVSGRALGIAAAVAALLLGLGATWWLARRADERATGAAAPRRDAGAPESRDDATLAAPGDGARRQVPAAQEPEPPEVPAVDADAIDVATVPARADGPGPVRARGRVVHADGFSTAGVGVGVTTTWSAPGVAADVPVLGRTEPDGTFDVEVPDPTGGDLLVVAHPGLATALGSVLDESGERDHLVVACDAIDLGGRVVDEVGAPVAGAHVELDVPRGAFASLGLVLDATTERVRAAETGADGRFELAGVPALDGARLLATREAYEPAELDAPRTSRADLELVLAPAEADDGERWLEGTVVHADGEPAPGAWVFFGYGETRADERGAFRLALGYIPDDARLVAAVRNYRPAIVERFDAVVKEANGRPAPVRLVLGGPTLEIHGRVLDAAGEPVPGWQVAIDEGTPVSVGRVPAVTAERMARDSWDDVVTDAEGRFTLEGLLERDYRVKAWNGRSLLVVRSESVPAGTDDLELRVPAGALHPRVAGRVVSRDRLPIAGVTVHASLVTERMEGGMTWITGASTTTDADGRFELADVPREEVDLLLSGDAILSRRFALDEGAPLEELLIEVERRCHFRLELGADAEGAPDAVQVLDADGARLDITSFSGRGSWSSSRLELAAAGGLVHAVSESARTLVLWRGGEEIGRRELHLTPGTVTVIEP